MRALALNNALRILNGGGRSQLATSANGKLNCVNGSSWISFRVEVQVVNALHMMWFCTPKYFLKKVLLVF